MRIDRRSLFILIVGVLLVVAPLAVRVGILGYNRRAAPPARPPLGVTLPTILPAPEVAPVGPLAAANMAGAQRTVLVDMAHFTGVSQGQLQPLAAALAQRGAKLDYWLGEFDAQDIQAAFTITGLDLSLPDQSQDLADRLVGADAMIVVTSFTNWSGPEVAALEAFVADGGNLLLISDPDVSGEIVDTTNRLGQPFGVVFEDGYLYDQVRNDEHFTHVPLADFQKRAAGLAEKQIFLYGSRSVSGRVDSQILTGESTLNSLRAGASGFTALALAAPRGPGYPANVMALGDLDVLTEPFVSRHDNRALLDLVADFLAGSLRTQSLTDFPAYLGNRVILLAGGDTPRDALFLGQIAGLQRFLEERGRTLSIQGSQSVPSLLGGGAAQPGGLPLADYLYLADYASAAAETDLLATGGLSMRQEVMGGVQARATVTASAALTGAIPTLGPAPTPTAPITRTIITLADGLELLGEESVVFLRRPVSQYSTVVAVLGHNGAAIQQGLTRLTTGNFANCVTSPDQAICPAVEVKSDSGGAKPGATATPTPGRASSDSGGSSQEGEFRILVIEDDNEAGEAGEAESGREAQVYVEFYSSLGMDVSEWRTSSQGSPTYGDLAGFNWVIWSSGEAEQGGPDLEEMDVVTDYLFGDGGVFTVSGRDVGEFGDGGAAQSLVDIVSTGINPILSDGLSETAIPLSPGASAFLINRNFTPDFYDTILVRGPDSAEAGLPVMLSQEMDYNGDGQLDGFIVLALSVTWLPEQVRTELLANLFIWASGLE